MSSKVEEKLTAKEARQLMREGKRTLPTTGIAEGFIQANLVILPSDMAEDFYQFCKLNPKPCPILDMFKPGNPEPKRAAPGADIRTDLPLYRIFENGELKDEVEDVTSYWRDDLVSFLLGCSYTFEHRLVRAGIAMRHWEEGFNIAAFVTNIQCTPAGAFSGPMVVSMRPVRRDMVDTAVRVTEQYGHSHGAPVHVGDHQEIGIKDLSLPEYGDKVEFMEDEVPVFWACGVTPQVVLSNAKPPLAITHSPGYMFITDLKDDDSIELFQRPA